MFVVAGKKKNTNATMVNPKARRFSRVLVLDFEGLKNRPLITKRIARTEKSTNPTVNCGEVSNDLEGK